MPALAQGFDQDGEQFHLEMEYFDMTYNKYRAKRRA